MDEIEQCSGSTATGKPCRGKILVNGTCRRHMDDIDYKFNARCIAITFCDVAENGVGMKKHGDRNDVIGTKMTTKYLRKLATKYDGEIVNLRLQTKYIPEDLSKDDFPKACVLILRDWCTNADELFEELSDLDWDTQALFRGVVKNKNARHNLCFSDKSSKADYSNGKGTVISFRRLPELAKNREKVSELLPEEMPVLAEGNLYYDVTKTYIGMHGDTERSVVMGLRLGDSIPLHYKWFYRTCGLGEATTIDLNHGDLYIMSYYAVGNNWKSKSIPTLRHSAGYEGLIKKLV